MARQSESEKTVAVAITSGQYHFVDEEGWQREWITSSAREWWRKTLWLKAGGHIQDDSEPRHS